MQVDFETRTSCSVGDSRPAAPAPGFRGDDDARRQVRHPVRGQDGARPSSDFDLGDLNARPGRLRARLLGGHRRPRATSGTTSRRGAGTRPRQAAVVAGLPGLDRWVRLEARPVGLRAALRADGVRGISAIVPVAGGAWVGGPRGPDGPVSPDALTRPSTAARCRLRGPARGAGSVLLASSSALGVRSGGCRRDGAGNVVDLRDDGDAPLDDAPDVFDRTGPAIPKIFCGARSW